MLMENYSEVVEPYTYHFTNHLTNLPDQISQTKDINLENTLSLHLSAYLMTKQFSNITEKDEIVAEDEPPEDNYTSPEDKPSTDPSSASALKQVSTLTKA